MATCGRWLRECPSAATGLVIMKKRCQQQADANGRSAISIRMGDTATQNGLCFQNDGLIYYTEDHYNHFERVMVSDEPDNTAAEGIDFEGWYTAKDDVAAYLNLYGVLPGNYITRDQANALGWSSKNK